MSESPSIARVAIDPEAHRRLKILAESDKRTLAGELEFLIERELQAKGISIEDLSEQS